MSERYLGEIGEFGLIDRLDRAFPAPPGVVGIGDDCAVLPGPGGVARLVTTDMLVEDIHFLRDRIPPGDLGYKSLAVNLSDIAAMGGTPAEAYLSLALPRDTELAWLDAFFDGMLELAGAQSVSLLGGDTTRSPGPIIVNVVVIGEVLEASVRRRSSGRPGDLLCVTGLLGESAAGLRALLDRPDPDPDPDLEALVRCHHRPRPHLAEGRWLARQPGVRAMMDVSDGIDSDIRRILERSRCGAVVELDHLPLSDRLRRVCARRGWDPVESACTGGEDYCLLVSVAPDAWPQVRVGFEQAFGRPLHAIGMLDQDAGRLRYLSKGKPVSLRAGGYDHFGA